MEPTKIPGANRVLAPPPDWDPRDGECSPLPVLFTGRFFQSAWQPSPQEIECMQAGAPVIVTIWGHSLPPHAVGTMPKPGYVPMEAYQAAALALRNLTFMCRTAKGLALGANADPQLLGSLELAESVIGQIDPEASRERGDPDAERAAVPPGEPANAPLLREIGRYFDGLVIDDEAGQRVEELRAKIAKALKP